MPELRPRSAATVAALRWLSAHPGCSLFEYYERNGPTWGLRTVARRGAAGQMESRLQKAGLITPTNILTPAGHAVVAAHA